MIELDLEQKMQKIFSDDSERAIDPKETVEKAKEVFERIGGKLNLQVYNVQDHIWAANANIKNEFELKLTMPLRGLFNSGNSVMGKGSTKEQCLASVWMELMERMG